MFTTVVQFHLPGPITLADASARFQSSAPKYKNLPGLISKFYIISEDGKTAGGVYHWKSRADAERVYNGEWRAFVSKLYGTEPIIQWFESPVAIDNTTGSILVDSGNAETR